jgi:hypothetical protein
MFEEETTDVVQDEQPIDPDESANEVVDNSGEVVDNPDDPQEEPEGEPGEEPAGEPEEEPAELEGSFYDTLRAAYPDADLSTPEAFQEMAVTHIQDLEEYRTKNRKANQILNDIFVKNPWLLELSKDLADGVPPKIAVARNVDTSVDPDDEYSEDIEKAKADHLAAQAEHKAKNEAYIANQQASVATLKTFAEKSKMPEATATKFFTEIDALLSEVATGKISENFLNVMLKGMNYEEAKEAARIAGRNEKIIAQKENRPKGDTVPHITSAGNTPTAPKRELDWASEVILSRTQ